MIIGIEAAHANRSERTGVEEYCWQMIQHFKTIIPADVRVILYSNTPLQAELATLPPNWEVRVLTWPLGKLWSQLRLAFELFLPPPDIFFAPAQLVPLWCPKKTITMLHDSAFKAVPQSYRFWGRQYLKIMNRLVLRNSARVLLSAEFNRREIQKYYGPRFNNKLQVIPLGFDASRFHPLSPEERAPLAALLARCQVHPPYIFYLGRLEEKKNTALLIDAFNSLKQKYTEPLQLVLAGKPGAGYDTVYRALKQSPFRSEIRELGFIGGSEAAQLLAGAAVFAFPSRYEGFGIPLLEAFAAGCPVVASPNGALPEVAKDATVFADPTNTEAYASELLRLLTNVPLRDQQIDRGVRRAREFSWAKTAAATWQTIVELAKKY